MTTSKTSRWALAGIVIATMIALLCSLSAGQVGQAFAFGEPDPYAQAAEVSLDDGEYSVEATLSGGTGKVEITSPTLLTVKNGHAVATIRWDSPHYDYMLVKGDKYLPTSVNSKKWSEFQIPVLAFDEPFAVVGDTTAMSTPYEVDYELTFNQESIVAGAPTAFQQQSSTSATGSASSAAGSAATTSGVRAAVSGFDFAIVAAVFVVALGVGIVIGVVRANKNR